MVTENVEIAFRSTGIPIIKRNLDELGNAANRATHGFFLLQRAIYTIGGFGLARALTSSLDALTNMENRLRLTTSSTAQLEAVQRELFAIAVRSRTSWEGVTEIYNRAALSAKALGIAQKDVLTFTEGVSKAAIASGAGAQEARAALIQLGQAMASNRLGGDELRSVLEQLPMVADIIANYMTSTNQFGVVTRGNIRQLGKEGKITAEVLVNAFKWAENDLDKIFQNMPLTIGQSLEIAKTNFMSFLDEFDDLYNISGKIASVIKFVSDNFMILANTAMFAAGAMAITFTGRALTSAYNFAMGIKQAVVQMTALSAAKSAMAAADVAAAGRDVAANAARQTQIGQNLLLIGQKKALIAAEIAETEYSVVNGRARSLQTGQFVSLEASKARLTQLTINLSRLEAIEAAQAGRLAGARAGQAIATNALAGATTRLAGAQAAQATLGARFAAQFPLLTGLIQLVTRSLSLLWAAMLANPITATIAVIGLLIYALMNWGNQIKVTADGIIGLKDWVIAAFQIMWETIGPWITAFIDGFSKAFTFVREGFAKLGIDIPGTVASFVTSVIDIMTFIPRAVIGIVAGIQAAWDLLPAAAASMAVQVANAVIQGFENMANMAIAAINKIIQALNFLQSMTPTGALQKALGITSGQIPEIPKVTIPKITNSYAGAGKAAGTAFSDAFNSSMNATSSATILGNAFNAVTERARKNSQDARADAALIAQANALNTDPAAGVPGAGGSPGGGKGGGENEKNFAAELAELQKKIELEKQWGLQKEINNNILAMEKTLKRELTDIEKEQVANATELLEIAKIQGSVLESILGPQEKLILGQRALNELLAQGAITMDVYNTKLREMQIAADQASGTLMGGFKAAIAGSIMSLSDLGKALGDWVVGAADSAADAIVEFAKTGEFNVRQFFNQLFAQLLKLAAKQILLQLLGGVLGIPVTGFSGGGSILPGFAGGGSILPTGPGSTDSQIVAFKKRPDERVDILTPGQQASQRKRAREGSGPTSATPQVNQKIINVLDSSIVGQYLDSPEGEQVLINKIVRSGILDKGRY